MKRSGLVFCALLCIGGGLFSLDRHFLKQNDGFCVRNILGNLSFDQRWETSLAPGIDLTQVFDQEYHYLAKGHQSYVFVSADHQYVLKFYRFPSHLRLLPWLNHPLSVLWSPRRQKIMAYNLEKLKFSFRSYKIAYEQIPQETGTLWIHLNPTVHLKKQIRLVDRMGSAYHLPLDSLFFVVQKKGELLFPSLEEMKTEEDLAGMQHLIDAVIGLIVERSRKGVKDTDAVLRKNYGWDGNVAWNIDVGRFILEKNPNISREARKITQPLALWLQQHQPELLPYYEQQLTVLEDE